MAKGHVHCGKARWPSLVPTGSRTQAPLAQLPSAQGQVGSVALEWVWVQRRPSASGEED